MLGVTKTYHGQLWHLSLLLEHLQSSSGPSQAFLSRYVTVRFLQALFSAYWMRVVITGVTVIAGKSLKSIASHKWVKTKLHPWLVVMKCLLSKYLKYLETVAFWCALHESNHF